MGDSCTQVGEPAVEKTGRPEGLPRTAVIKRLCRRASGCKKATSLRILYRQVAKPGEIGVRPRLVHQCILVV